MAREPVVMMYRVGLKWERLCSVAIAALILCGCGATAFGPAIELPEELVAMRPPALLSGDEALGAIAAAESSAAVQAEGAPSKFELYVGFSTLNIGDKVAGTSGTTTITWEDAFKGTLGLDAQLVLRGPPRSASTLAAGDTFLLLRITIDGLTGQEPVTGQDYDDLRLVGGWIDGRTVFNPLGNTRVVRPYTQYGGGLVSYANDVDRGGTANWSSTLALAFHISLGIEVRTRGLGFYADIGVQNISAPNLASGASTVERQAQDLLMYPVRFGVMLRF